MLDIIYIIIGVCIVLFGADRLTEGAVNIARRLNMPEIVIGLTIVAIGTSMPEFFVSLMSALKGTSDMAIGNIVGSNLFNTLLITGVAACVASMQIGHATVRKDIPFAAAATLLLVTLCFDRHISRLDGVIMIFGLLFFFFYTLRSGRKGNIEMATPEDLEEGSGKKQQAMWLSIFWTVCGLSCLVFGSHIFVSGAANVAKSLGVSDAVVGLTILAGGTSLPELATSVVAAYKGQSGIAIGNVIGSNVLNILMIVGLTAVIHPLYINHLSLVDFGLMLFSIVLLWFFCFTKYKVERWEGAVLTTLFIGYLGWLVSQNI